MLNVLSITPFAHADTCEVLCHQNGMWSRPARLPGHEMLDRLSGLRQQRIELLREYASCEGACPELQAELDRIRREIRQILLELRAMNITTEYRPMAIEINPCKSGAGIAQFTEQLRYAVDTLKPGVRYESHVLGSETCKVASALANTEKRCVCIDILPDDPIASVDRRLDEFFDEVERPEPMI